jgi:hypothetical protein
MLPVILNLSRNPEKRSHQTLYFHKVVHKVGLLKLRELVVAWNLDFPGAVLLGIFRIQLVIVSAHRREILDLLGDIQKALDVSIVRRTVFAAVAKFTPNVGRSRCAFKEAHECVMCPFVRRASPLAEEGFGQLFARHLEVVKPMAQRNFWFVEI